MSMVQGFAPDVVLIHQLLTYWGSFSALHVTSTSLEVHLGDISQKLVHDLRSSIHCQPHHMQHSVTSWSQGPQ